MNTKVEFCGKERKFQRCPNRTLVEYQKLMEDLQEETIPLANQERDFEFKLTELVDEQEAIDKHIELLDKLEDPTDTEIRECISLAKEKLALQKEVHAVRKEVEEFQRGNKEFFDKYADKLKEAYGEFASVIFKDFDKSDIEEADSTDLTIAPRLGELYRLATTGAKQKDIDKLFAKIVKDSFR